jgi:transmembrane sensor
MKRISAPPAPDPAEPRIGRAVVAWAQGLGRNDDIVWRVEAKVRRRRRRRLSAVSGVAALLLVVGSVWSFRRTVPDSADRPASASLTAPARQTLPDGSVVELKDDARLAARFAAAGVGARRVALERGEAHFTVVPDPSRPFIVAAGGLEVRAVGTAFSVELAGSQITVLVTEGTVAVARAAVTPGGSAEISLTAGQRVAADLSTAAALPAPEDVPLHELESRLSWRIPPLRFSNTPLAEAVALFNQHSSARLVLDPALAGLRIGGAVRPGNIEPFLLLLKNEFGIEGSADAAGTIHLRRP